MPAGRNALPAETPGLSPTLGGFPHFAGASPPR